MNARMLMLMLNHRFTTAVARVAAPCRRLVSWMFLLVATVAGMGAPSFSARVDRNVIPVGESLTLTLTFEGLKPAAAPQLPALPNLAPAGGISEGSEFSIANGQQSARYTYAYTLVAQQPGDVTIPPLQVQAGGRSLVSQAIALKVVPTGAASQANTISNLAFVRLVVPRTNLFVGEPVAIEIHLYWQAAQDIRMPQLPGEGFAIDPIPKPAQTRTQIGNAIYNLAVFKCAVTPVRSGDLTLGPVESPLTVLVPVNNPRRSRDPFDAFFGGGQQYQPRPTTLYSDTVPVRVLPLPTEGAPEGFNGAIGSYTLNVTAGPTNVAVGDPITVRVQISGRGKIDALLYPAQTDWREFTTYPATSKSEPADELGLAGTRSFEQVVIPQNHEIKSLPPVKFSFFDPALRTYRTLSGPAIPLTVRPTGAPQSPLPSLTNATGNTAAPASDDIVHIRARPDGNVPARSLLKTPWFLALQILPPALWLGLLASRKRRESLANNPRARRQREVAQRIRDGLKELRTHADARQSDQFFATLFRLLQEQLGERLDLPASAITEAVIDEHLRSRQLGDDTLKLLHELFQACNLARYAPMQSSQELAALIPKLESVLRALQQIKP